MSKKSKKLQIRSDIIAIVISFAMAALSFFTSPLIFASFYIFMGLLRLVILLIDLILVRKGDSKETIFKKERLICRIVGVVILLMNSALISVVLVSIFNKQPNGFFLKYKWLAYGYIIYAIYKFVYATILLFKARTFSPYKETVCYLSFITGFSALINLEVLVAYIFNQNGSSIFRTIESVGASFIALVIFVLAIFMIVSRKVPKEIQNK